MHDVELNIVWYLFSGTVSKAFTEGQGIHCSAIRLLSTLVAVLQNCYVKKDGIEFTIFKANEKKRAPYLIDFCKHKYTV